MIKCFNKGKKIRLEIFKYPAGEIAVRASEEFDRIICFFENSDDILAASMLSDINPQAVVVFPYLPFGREDRHVAPLASFELNTMMRLFAHRQCCTFDKHSGVWANCFDDTNTVAEFIYDTYVASDPEALIFPDEGARIRYQTLCALSYGHLATTYHGTKVRDLITGNITDYSLPEIKEHKLLVIDDICDGGKTFIELAKKLPGKELYLYVTHGIFSKGLDELLKYYKHIYTTNTIYKGESNEHITVYRCI